MVPIRSLQSKVSRYIQEEFENFCGGKPMIKVGVTRSGKPVILEFDEAGTEYTVVDE